MQDKEPDGSTKTLVEIVARAICGHDTWECWVDDAERALTAIKEAGYAVVPREPTWAMHVASLDEVGRAIEGLTWDSGRLYRAMITAGEE